MKAPFEGFTGTFDDLHQRNFDRIDREMMRDLGELKQALAEFDAFRHVWAEMSANNVAPGRGSELQKRMEVMQGHALMLIDAAAWRLRLRIRGSTGAKPPMPDSLR